MTPTQTSRLEAIDESLVAACEHWARAAARERSIAENLEASHAKRFNRGQLDADTDAGDRLRERIRACEDHAKKAEEHALKIRAQMLNLPPRTRGAGKKAPVVPEKPARDPATQALIDREAKKKADREAAAESRRVCREAQTECAHDPRCAWVDAVTIHDIDHMSMSDD